MSKQWTKNSFTILKAECAKKLNAIKAEQQQYNAGIEKGIDMTITEAIRIFENEQSNSCIYCNFKSSDVGADFPEPDKFNLIRGKNDNGKYDYSIATNQNNVFRTCKIRFCPMCGRHLDTEEEKNG